MELDGGDQEVLIQFLLGEQSLLMCWFLVYSFFSDFLLDFFFKYLLFYFFGRIIYLQEEGVLGWFGCCFVVQYSVKWLYEVEFSKIFIGLKMFIDYMLDILMWVLDSLVFDRVVCVFCLVQGVFGVDVV